MLKRVNINWIFVLAIGTAIIPGYSYAGSALKLPAKKSQFDGLYGIRIDNGAKGEGPCRLVFPQTFGYRNAKQLNFLKRIVNHSVEIEHDVDCVMPVAYDALDHIRLLAIKKQDKAAARMLLYPPGHGGFELGGGELEESYGEWYIIPVIEKYKKLGALLDNKTEKYVVHHTCLAWVDPNADPNLDINNVIKALNKRGLKSLASKIKTTCKEYEVKYSY